MGAERSRAATNSSCGPVGAPRQVRDDDLAERVYEECENGDRLCGGCKEQAAELMREFLEDHQEKREEAKELLDSLDLDLDVDGSRRGVVGDGH